MWDLDIDLATRRPKEAPEMVFILGGLLGHTGTHLGCQQKISQTNYIRTRAKYFVEQPSRTAPSWTVVSSPTAERHRASSNNDSSLIAWWDPSFRGCLLELSSKPTALSGI